MSLLVLGAALLTLAGADRTAPLSASLDVRRAADAADCPDGPALSSAMAEILDAGRDDKSHVDSPAGSVTAKITFDRLLGDYRAEMTLEGARAGTRTLTDAGPSCAALGRAVAIALSLLLDGDATTDNPGAPGPAASEPAWATSGFLALQAGPTWGAVGRASWGAGLAFDVHLGNHVSLLLFGERVLSQTTTLSPGTVAVSLWGAHLAACGGPGGASPFLRIVACAVGSTGLLHGEGQGFETSQSANRTWWAAGAAVRGEALFRRRWLLALTASVEVPLYDYTFSVADVGEVRKVSASGRAVEALLVGLGIRLW